MSESVTNILLVGVGGQGTLLASEIISETLMQAGFDVKKSEIHGMSQRGGSVVSHVRFGPVVYSPIIPEGEGDIMLGFELLETYRYLHLLKPNASAIVNNLEINPASVTTGKEPYPSGIAQRIITACPTAMVVDGLRLATEAGSPKAANTVLIGALASRLSIEQNCWLAAIERMVPAKAKELNRKAFALGYSQGSTAA